jgi:hypothetical protein
MSERTSRALASGGLVIGALLGIAGTFAPGPVRGLLWGLDGIALVAATTLLAIHYLRKGNDVVAAGFFVFVVGEALILASAAMDLAAGAPTFGAGAGLWAAALFLLSAPPVAASWVRAAGALAGLLLAVVAVRIFAGDALTALSRPLPFFAYPLLVATLLGWAWERARSRA